MLTGLFKTKTLPKNRTTYYKISISKEDTNKAILRCKWTFKVPQGCLLNVEITLPSDARQCSSERLHVIDGQNIHGKLLMSINYTLTKNMESLSLKGHYLTFRLDPSPKGTSCLFYIKIGKLNAKYSLWFSYQLTKN